MNLTSRMPNQSQDRHYDRLWSLPNPNKHFAAFLRLTYWTSPYDRHDWWCGRLDSDAQPLMTVQRSMAKRPETHRVEAVWRWLLAFCCLVLLWPSHIWTLRVSRSAVCAGIHTRTYMQQHKVRNCTFPRASLSPHLTRPESHNIIIIHF